MGISRNKSTHNFETTKLNGGLDATSNGQITPKVTYTRIQSSVNLLSPNYNKSSNSLSRTPSAGNLIRKSNNRVNTDPDNGPVWLKAAIKKRQQEKCKYILSDAEKEKLAMLFAANGHKKM